jgi:tetratricopeptide (TPR) repeat protein
MMLPPQTGRSPRYLTDDDARKLLRAPHAADERDFFATDPDPEIRRLGRLALRRDDINDLFALGDKCALRSLTTDHRLLVFYVGKALTAFRRASDRARNDIDRLTAHRATRELIEWVSHVAQAYPTRRNIAVALWAAADDEQSGELAELSNPTLVTSGDVPGDATRREKSVESQENEDTLGSASTQWITDAALGTLLAAYLRPSLMQPVTDDPSLERTMTSDVPPSQIDSYLSVDGSEIVSLSSASADSYVDDAVPAQEAPSQDDAHTIPPPSPYTSPELLLTYTDGESALSASNAAGDALIAPNETLAEDRLEQSLSSFENDAYRRPFRPSSARRSDVHNDEFNIGDRIDDRYEVADVRRGGMGVVYLCYDHDQREPIALKSFQARFLENERAVMRFQQEAFTWIRLEKHRHIVHAKLVQNIFGRPYIMLEHISGPEGLDADLRSWIERKRLTLRNTLEFGLHIALGMQHATQRVPGLVHRDLKPANILVTHDGIAKVTDFGLVRSLDLADLAAAEIEKAIARGEDERLTRVGAVIGTAPYLSPEQARGGKDVDMRSDIYAFGCLVYEMLTGRHIFTYKKLDDWLKAHKHEQPSFDLATQAATPPRLTALVMMCLQKDPADRPQDWGSIVDALLPIYVDVTGENPLLQVTGPALEARELMDKGYSLTELGRLDEALEAYDRAIQLQPDYAWAWARKGRTLRLLNRYTEAIACYDQALTIQPQYAWAYKGKGIVLERLGRPLDALECYQIATEIDPGDVWNWYNQADALHNMGRYDEAITLLRQALKLDPAHPNSWAKLGQVYRLTGDFHGAIDAYEQAITLDPTYAWAQNGYGLALKAISAYRDALMAFKRAARYQPDEVWHWYNLTEMLVELDQYDEAVQPAQEAVRINPDHAFSWAKLGQVLRYLKRYDDALAAYERAIRLQPDYAWAVNGKGIVLEQMGRYDQALQAYQTAALISKGDMWHFYNQGNVLALMGRYDEALPLLAQAVEINPEHARSWARYGNVLRQLGRYADAIFAYQRAITLDAGYAWAFNELGMTYEALRRYDDALHQYRLASAADPSDPFYIYQQVDLLMMRGENSDAVALLETALKQDARNSRTWSKHGQALRRLNRHQDALRSYARAIELDPNNAWAWNGRGLVLAILHKHDDALASFRRAAQIDPSDVWYWYNQGDELVALNRHQDAVDVLLHALKLNPAHPESWAKLGQAYRRLKRDADALAAYDQALAINPHYAWAWNGRGLSLEALGRREESIASYERALAEDDGVIWYYTNQVDLLLEMRREKQALAVIERAIERLPANAIGWARHGQVMRRVRDYHAAIESYIRALEIDPSYAWAWNGRGLAHWALNEYEAAAAAYERAVRYNANDVWYWHNWGEVLIALGDCAGAVEKLERALSILPSHNASRQKLAQAKSCLENG